MSEVKTEKEVPEGERKSSWAEHLGREPTPEELEQITLSAQRTAAIDSAILAVPKILNDIAISLRGVLAEMKAVRGADVVEEAPEPYDESAPEPVEEKPQAPATLPENLESDVEIEKYYKEFLAPVLPEDLLAKTEIRVAEDKVIIKLPYLRDTNLFGNVARKLRELGGQYQSAGKDSHFLLSRE